MSIRLMRGHSSQVPLAGSPVFSEEAQAGRHVTLFVERALDDCLLRVARLNLSDPKPTQKAVALASEWLSRIFQSADKINELKLPHVTSSEQGEIVCEWWHHSKKLTMYFGNSGAEFIKVWGTNMDTEMQSGELSEGWNLTSLWIWLHE